MDRNILPLLKEHRTALGATSVAEQARQDYAQQLLDTCREEGPDRGSNGHSQQERALTSANGTWLPIIRAAILHSREGRISRLAFAWFDAIWSVLCTVRIDWVPGTHAGKVTSKHILRLVGNKETSMASKTLSMSSGSLKRQAAVAELPEQAWGTKHRRRREIHFGSEFPFRSIPEVIRQGFEDIYSERGSDPVSNHYQLAQNWLVKRLDDNDFRIQLMLMQVL